MGEVRDEHPGGEDTGDGDEEGDLLDHGLGVGGQFVDCVEGAPEVGDFVLKYAAREGEDAMDGLGELEDGGVEDGVRFG